MEDINFLLQVRKVYENEYKNHNIMYNSCEELNFFHAIKFELSNRRINVSQFNDNFKEKTFYNCIIIFADNSYDCKKFLENKIFFDCKFVNLNSIYKDDILKNNFDNSVFYKSLIITNVINQDLDDVIRKNIKKTYEHEFIDIARTALMMNLFESANSEIDMRSKIMNTTIGNGFITVKSPLN